MEKNKITIVGGFRGIIWCDCQYDRCFKDSRGKKA